MTREEYRPDWVEKVIGKQLRKWLKFYNTYKKLKCKPVLWDSNGFSNPGQKTKFSCNKYEENTF